MSYIVSVYTNLETTDGEYHRVLICETDLPVSELADGLHPEKFNELIQEVIKLMETTSHNEATIRNLRDAQEAPTARSAPLTLWGSPS